MEFGEISGLEMNEDKTSIYLGGVHEYLRNTIVDILNVKESKFLLDTLGYL